MEYKGKVIELDRPTQTRTPLKNIPVTDGRNTVLTDENGQFSLPGWERARVISLGVLTQNHSDWFINIEGHKGDFDFEIQRADTQNKNFNFLVTSDIEIDRREELPFVPFIKQVAEKNGSGLVVHGGDIAGVDSLKRQYLALNKETIGCPVRYVIGNHDFSGTDYGESLFEKLYGPTWYSFDYGDIHFIVISIGFGDNPTGYQPSDQWKWLENDLKLVDKNKKIVALSHGECPGDEKGYCPTYPDVKVDLVKEGLIAWVFGHRHDNYSLDINGVASICTSRPDSGGIDSSAAGVRKVSIDGHSLTSKMVYNKAETGENDKPIWSTQLDNEVEFSNPLKVENDYIVCTANAGYPQNCGIYRICGETGKIKYVYKVKSEIKGDAAYSEGKIYAEDSLGYVYCIDAKSGELLWETKYEFGKKRHIRIGVIVAKDSVIVGSPSAPWALNKNTGEVIWKANPSINHGESPAKYVYDELRNQIICSVNWTRMFAVDLATGKENWELKGLNATFFRTSTPLVTKDFIYICGNNTVSVVNAETGKEVKQNKLDETLCVSGAPVLDDGVLYMPTATTGVISLDAETLEVLKVYPCGETRLTTAPYICGNPKTVEATPIVQGEKLIFVAGDGYIWVYNKKTAEVIKKIAVGEPMITKPILEEDKIVCVDFTGRVFKFEL